MTDQLLNGREAAKFLGVSKSTFYQVIAAYVPHVKFYSNSIKRWKASDLAAFIEGSTNQAARTHSPKTDLAWRKPDAPAPVVRRGRGRPPKAQAERVAA